MPLISACCCWRELETGSRASAYFTGATAIINFIIDVWLLVKLHWLDNNLEDHEIVNFLPPGIIVFIYFELFFNLALLASAVALMIGINRRHEGYKFIFAWVWTVGIHRAYEIFLGIYTLSYLGSHRITDILYIVPEFIFVMCYWFLNTILLIAAIICVMSFWDELMDEVYGKFRRVKYLTMLANIRNAAMQNRSMHTGINTPRSYYGHSVASTLHMAPSQMSIQGAGRPLPSGNPYTHHRQPQQYQPPPQQYAPPQPPQQQQQYAPQQHQQQQYAPVPQDPQQHRFLPQGGPLPPKY